MIRRLWSEQVRVTFWAWIATLGAAAMLAPLTTSKRYLLLGGFGAALVSITGALLRARRAHLVVVALLELVVAFEWIILVFARSETVFGFIPGPDAVGELRDRWASYGDVANQYAAPLPEHPDVTMAMAIVLVGLGIVVDVVAVSWRRASLLGLLFLAVYMTPVSILGGEISIIAFLFGALGYIFLLAADERERLTHWGRQISTAGSLWDRPNEVDEGGLRRNGTRIGLSAIALAAVLPVLIPTLSPHYFGQSGSGGPSGSGGDGVSVDESPALDLRRNLFDPSDQPLMQVTTSDGVPEYFGLAAMDEFDGDSWTVGERSEDNSTSTEQAVPVPIGIEVSTTTLPVSYQVAIDESFDTSWLPLRYYPTDIEIDPPWRVDEDHLDAYTDSDESAAGLSYNFTADLPLPTERQLRQASEPSAEYGEYVELPADLPEVFRTEAERVTDGARTTFDKARALEAYFHDSGEFDYSLNASEVGGTGLDDLEDFLTESKVGYCEQFATSMAIMLRSLNIPTRVVVGFLQPEQVDEDTWEFLGTDMHAWPEVYFPGAGWTRFEPTPNTLDSAGSEPVAFPTANATEPTTPTTGSTTLSTRDPLDRGGQESEAAGTDRNNGSGGSSTLLWIVPLSLIGLGFIVSLPRMVRSFVRRRRWARARDADGVAEAAWAELRDRVIDLRMDWHTGATPRAIGRTLRERLPDDRDASGTIVSALNRLVLAIEQGRYARTIRNPEGLRSAVETVADALASRQTARRRFLARWLPRSLVRTSKRRTKMGSERIGELLISVED
jgi:transglutaminase-like putative cysteine protease